ncbi:hypothetical protein P5P86_10615 [Nocardioides sp. BP30]|uniref:hypothetical protein n=1 Tax=Nocardioides sp. BP30 TaxID=3036374 RepID=UPI0024691302|nr:hypothetical protein [Nocardioides sp. BP30]WGL50419.1 hypothetical protein P5P86_10615 [Nocardioides sp. BP30]
MTETTTTNEPFHLSSLPELGLTAGDLRRALERGEVRRVVRGVYVAAAAPDSIELRAAALRLVVGPAQVVVDRTAAWLHGTDTYAAVELGQGAPIETCALRGHTRSRLAGVRGRSRDLRPEDIVELDGLRVTTPLRTALDLGCHLRRREAFAALCSLARGHTLEPCDLVTAADRFVRRRGVVQLRELVPLVDLRLESPREAWTLLAIHDAGLPLPEPQLWIEVDGVPTFRLDLAYPQQRVYVEYDGVEFHDRSDEQRDHDRARRRWLREHGWTAIVVQRGDFTGAELDRWLGELRRALTAATYTTRRW